MWLVHAKKQWLYGFPLFSQELLKCWECHETKTSEACTWDLDALAEVISVRD